MHKEFLLALSQRSWVRDDKGERSVRWLLDKSRKRMWIELLIAAISSSPLRVKKTGLNQKKLVQVNRTVLLCGHLSLITFSEGSAWQMRVLIHFLFGKAMTALHLWFLELNVERQPVQKWDINERLVASTQKRQTHYNFILFKTQNEWQLKLHNDKPMTASYHVRWRSG